jgi:hypothetical protein
MLKTLNWSAIQSAYKRIVAEHSIDGKSVIYFRLVTEDGDPQTRMFYFEDFLKIMWKLFDSPKSFKKIIISKEKDKDVIYTYEFNPVAEKKPDDYNTDIIKQFKNMSPSVKSLYVDLLINQILEEK